MKTFIFSLLFVLTFGFNSFAASLSSITASSYCDIALPEEAKDKVKFYQYKINVDTSVFFKENEDENENSYFVGLSELINRFKKIAPDIQIESFEYDPEEEILYINVITNSPNAKLLSGNGFLDMYDFNNYLFDKKYLSELQQTDEYIKCYDKAKKDTFKNFMEYKDILKLGKVDGHIFLNCSPSYIKNGNKLRIACEMTGSLSY